MLDNVDDMSFLLELPVESNDAVRKRRIDYLPVCDHGSILVTSRSVDEAQRIVERGDVIKVRPMEMDDAVALLERKLGDQRSRTDIASLAEMLECIPLALTQAASYILQRGRRYTIQRYLQKLQRCHSSKKNVLDEEAQDYQRDREAKNAISTTWQISFEHIYRTRRSAANLLAVMSLCGRQAIPDELIRTCTRSGHVPQSTTNLDADAGAGTEVDMISNDKSDEEYRSDGSSEQSLNDDLGKDLTTLVGYSFVSMTTDESAFEMHRLVQQAT